MYNYLRKDTPMNFSTETQTIYEDDIMFEGDTWLCERDFWCLNTIAQTARNFYAQISFTFRVSIMSAPRATL